MRIGTLASAFLLAGCGVSGSPASSAGAKPDTRNLLGNWLLAGELPEFPFDVSGKSELSVTLSTTGDQIVGYGQVFIECPSTGGPASLGTFGAGGGFVAEGSVAADGTFTLMSPATTVGGLPLISVTLSGTVPATAGGSWPGSYTINPNGDGGCAQQQAGSATAEAIAPFQGTYTAVGSYVDGANQTPVQVSVTLQQGTTATLPDGELMNAAYVLGGSMRVEGIPCFGTGTVVKPSIPQPNGVGSVAFGGLAFPAFRMGDGALVELNVAAADAGTQQLDANSLAISGDGCASNAQRQVRLGNFTRVD